jgi:hypothetical protein
VINLVAKKKSFVDPDLVAPASFWQIRICIRGLPIRIRPDHISFQPNVTLNFTLFQKTSIHGQKYGKWWQLYDAEKKDKIMSTGTAVNKRQQNKFWFSDIVGSGSGSAPKRCRFTTLKKNTTLYLRKSAEVTTYRLISSKDSSRCTICTYIDTGCSKESHIH